MRRTLPFVVALLGLTAACTPEYEYDRPGTWRVTGANDTNLRAMVADPQDLTNGRHMLTDRGSGASRAVTRLLTDRRRPLLNTTASKVGSISDSGADSPLPDTPAPANAAPATAPSGGDSK